MFILGFSGFQNILWDQTKKLQISPPFPFLVVQELDRHPEGWIGLPSYGVVITGLYGVHKDIIGASKQTTYFFTIPLSCCAGA